MTRCAPLVLLLFCLPCSAQSKRGTPESGRGGDRKEKVDAHALVEALANRNRPPKHVGEFHDPIFDPMFDWKEDARAWRALRSLPKHAEEVWPELVSHLDDDRYCVTYESFSDYTYDFTVGEVCREIIVRTLSSGYFDSVRPGRKEPHLALRNPRFLRAPQTLKEWCEERRGRTLYELQIELCDWATAELSKPDEIPQVDEKTAAEWIAVIKKAAESLRRSKTAVPWDGFGFEEIKPYHRERAEEIRKRYRSRKE